MNKQIRFIPALALGMAVFLMPNLATAATTIDFKGVPPFTDFPTYSEDGFTLTPSVGQVRINDAFSPGDNAAQPSIGFGQGFDSSFTFTNDNSVPFDAVSIDLLEAGPLDFYGVTFIGTKADLSTVSHTFTLDGIDGKETFSFPSDFTGLISLKIAEDSSNNFFTENVQIDNVVLIGDVSPPDVDVTVSTTGLTPRRVTCENLRTRKTILIDPASAQPWNCEAAGLKIRTGDRVEITVRGNAN